MTHLRRIELQRLLELTDALLDVATPSDLGRTLLSRLPAVVGGDTAVWHEVDIRPPVREYAFAWPTERVTLELAQRAAPVLGTHPLFAIYRAHLAQGARTPPTARISEYVTRRQWHHSPLYREALPDVDDQLLLITAARGPLVQFVSVERKGRSFTHREQDILLAAGRHITAAVRRARTQPHPAIQTSPRPQRMLLDPRPPTHASTPPGDQLLTPRQRQVLTLVAEGLTDAQIARRLGISSRTTSKHLQRIYTTLHVTNRIDALATALPRPLPLPRASAGLWI